MMRGVGATRERLAAWCASRLGGHRLAAIEHINALADADRLEFVRWAADELGFLVLDDDQLARLAAAERRADTGASGRIRRSRGR
jgi:hypothetical protein